MATSGDEWWRRWVAGVLTQKALTCNSFVPSGEGDMHSCSLMFLLSEQRAHLQFFSSLSCGTNFASVAVQFVWRIQPACVSLLCCRDFDFCDSCVVCSDR